MYDHVIVGAGSAGAVLAERLSSNAAKSVALIEAGPDYPDEPSIPSDLVDARGLGGPQHDWKISVTPLAGRTLSFLRGKVVGGTSAMNAAAAQWGHPDDFALWEQAGLAEWAWDKIAPYYRELENDPGGIGAHHGRAGPIPIARFTLAELIPLQRAFHDACVAHGLRKVADHNNLDGRGGVGIWPMNRVGTRRISTLLSHIYPARSRKNLTIRSRTLVDRVTLDGPRAAAVMTADGETIAGRNVTICAGAINTPAILMRSGVGPAAALKALGIQPTIDLPAIGAQVRDHAAVPIWLVPNDGECVPGRDPRMQVMARFTSPRSDLVDDMQFVLTSHVDIRAIPALLAEAGVPVLAALRVALMAPRGAGALKLVSRDPAVQPQVDLNYLEDAEDTRRLADGVRQAWQLLKSAPFAGGYRKIVGLTDDIINSDDRLLHYIRANIGTYCHALGAVPIGHRENGGALDERCKVHGTDNLYVVDASIFPVVPRTVPNFTIMMFGLRAADWLSKV